MNMSMGGMGGMDFDDHQQQSDAASNASLLLHAVLLHASPHSPHPASMPPAAPPPAASGNLWLGALSGQPGCAAALGARLLILLLFTLPNLLSSKLVGQGMVGLGAFVMAPFVVMSAWGLGSGSFRPSNPNPNASPSPNPNPSPNPSPNPNNPTLTLTPTQTLTLTRLVPTVAAAGAPASRHPVGSHAFRGLLEPRRFRLRLHFRWGS